MKIETRINKIIAGYDNKPQVNIQYNGIHKEIVLTGGHWLARQDIEDYFTQKNMIVSIINRPTGKTISLK